MLDELTMRKCVDGELSEDEQREFLKLVDTTDGWRELSIAFLEEQAWNSAFSTAPIVSEAIVTTKPAKSARTGSWSTTVLSVAVALAAGLLIGDIWQDWNQSPTQVTANRPIIPPEDVKVGSVASSGRKTTPVSEYQMNVVGPNGRSHLIRGQVFDPMDFEYEQQQRQAQRLDEQQLWRLGLGLQTRQQVRRVQLDSGDEIMVPVEVMRAYPMQ